MNRRVVPLTERRTRPVKLPRAEANFLLTHVRHLIEVIPTAEPRTYQLRPRGYVGYIDGPTARYVISPKIPWPNLLMLLGCSREAGTNTAEPEGGLLAVLAEEFAARLEAVARAGLVAGYGEASNESPFLRGKLRTADQMRDAAAGAFPDHFHVDEPVFDLHTPWNRIPKATAAALLRRELPLAVRKRVEDAVLPLAIVPDEPATDADFTATNAEPRAAGYAPLVEVCRLILNGLTCADPLATGSTAFLIDLERIFERYLFTSVKRVLEARDGWQVEAHPPFSIGPTALQPDILIRKDGEPFAVLDAKWKSATYDADDLHQILAYATLAGVERVGLVYCGQADDWAHFHTPGNRVRVGLHRLRVVGTAEELEKSVTELTRRVRKG